jgi:hypothetical protein
VEADEDRTMVNENDNGRLREAAITLLQSSASLSGELPVALRTGLEDLRAALSRTGHTPQAAQAPAATAAAAEPAPDPFRHVLSILSYTDDGAEPIPLERFAADKGRSLDSDRGLEDHLPGQPPRNVTVTELRAMIIARLLRELAARISPGAAFGPGRSGLALAKVATDLAEELVADTIVGPL